MLQNDPRFAGNPMAQNMLNELANNPQMAAQVSQMMRDPAVMSQIQAMQGSQSPFFQNEAANANATSTPNGLDPNQMMQMAQMMQHLNASRLPQAGGALNQQLENQAPRGQNDVETTEEEMIAEAIRRSLQDS